MIQDNGFKAILWFSIIDSTLKDRSCYTDLDKTNRDKCLDETDYTCSHCFNAENCNTEESWAGNHCYSCSGKSCNEPNESTSKVTCLAGTSIPIKSTECQTKLDGNNNIFYLKD